MRIGFSFVELLLVLAIIAIVLAVAIPTANTALMSASETAVIREMHTIHQAEMQHFSQFGRYSPNFAELGPRGAKLIPASLATGERNGYRFMLSTTQAGFTAQASPKVFGKNGRRTFFIDEDGLLRQNWGPEPATAESAEVQ